MKLLVCIRQVPDSTTRVRIGPEGTAIATDGLTWSISPYDEYALELALEHKDGAPDTTVTAVTVGGPRAKDALRQALAMGCDDAVHLTGEGAEALGPLGIAAALAGAVRDLGPDIVLCGVQAADDDQGFVGPALAEALGWPHLGTVTRIASASGATEVWTETEGGHAVWAATGPVVLTVQKSDREPRYPSLPGIMKAKKKDIPERPVSGVADPVRLEIVRLELPPARGAGKLLREGDMRTNAAELAKLLRDEAKVL